MVKTIVKLVNLATATYFLIMVGNAIYEAGKDAERNAASSPDVDAATKQEEVITINGKKYSAVK